MTPYLISNCSISFALDRLLYIKRYKIKNVTGLSNNSSRDTLGVYVHVAAMYGIGSIHRGIYAFLS